MQLLLTLPIGVFAAVRHRLSNAQTANSEAAMQKKASFKRS